MISSRTEVTEMIISAKVRKGLKWADVAATIGLSKEWTTAGCLGQMTFNKEQAEAIGKIFELSDEVEFVPENGFVKIECGFTRAVE